MSAIPSSPGGGVTPDKIDALVASWERNRNLYPGWVITPPDNRDSLWLYTRAWIVPILSRTEGEAPNRGLIWLRELNWRCEMCLIQLWEDFAARIQSVLARIQPFSELLSSSPVQLHPEPENTSALDWQKLSRAWIGLALALLRYYRETLASEQFEDLAKQLLLISGFDSAISSFVLYQRCLMALERLDYGGTRLTITDWEKLNEPDPFWLARRASIRAEIGDIESAEKEADSALRNLRQAASRSLLSGSTVADIYSLSREGWIMALVRGIKFRQLSGQPDQTNLGRWDQLAALRCNPWVDLQGLEILLSAPPRKATPPVERTRTGVRLHFSNEGMVDRLKPAFQAARVLEEAGYPVRVDYLNLGAELLKRAAEWLSDEYPERALPLFLRLSDDDTLRTFLTDHRVATFDRNIGDVARATASTALDQSVNDFLAADVSAKPSSFLSTERRIKVSLGLLEAFAATMDDKNLAILAERILSLRKNVGIAKDFRLISAVDRFISKSFFCMSPRERSNHLLSIISQPLQGVDVKTIPGLWNEDAATALHWSTVAPDRSAKLPEWEEAVRRLLRFTTEGPDTARAQAIWRCAYLNRVGALTGNEQRELLDAIWNGSGEALNPKLPLVPPWVILLLPEPQSGSAATSFKSRILGEPLSPFLRKIPQPDGRIETRWEFHGGVEDPLISAFRATAKPWETGDNSRLIPSVEWTPEELDRLVSLMEKWWDDEGHQLALSPPFFFADFGRVRTQMIVDILGYVVFLSLREKQLKLDRSLSLLRKLEKDGVSVECALPLRVAADPSEAESVAPALRSALVSTDRDRTAGAIEGIYLWAVYSSQGGSPKAPGDLIREVGAAVRMRRSLVLDTAIVFSSRLLALLPSETRDPIVDEIRVGLQYLAEELKYRSPTQYSGPVPYEDVPRFRILCGQLANELAHCLGSDDPSVKLWTQEIAEEPLNYVRHAVKAPLE